MEIGRKILNLRRDLGVDQRTLARDASVTPSALSRIEAGIHLPRGMSALGFARRLGVTADYMLDETAPYPPPAYEILANLVDTTKDEPKDQPTMVSARELRVVEAFRDLELERKRLLEAALGGTREKVRLAAWLMGAELPGEDPREIARFKDRVRAIADGAG
jgi:transcriptional regulator with XRE-family HTH domain